jgi:hypothetical protein
MDGAVSLESVGHHHGATKWTMRFAKKHEDRKKGNSLCQCSTHSENFCVCSRERCLENRKIDIEGVMPCTSQGGA